MKNGRKVAKNGRKVKAIALLFCCFLPSGVGKKSEIFDLFLGRQKNLKFLMGPGWAKKS
jgi:hypothetical protein